MDDFKNLVHLSERLKEAMALRGVRQADVLRRAAPYCQDSGIRLGSNDLSQYLAGKITPKADKLAILSTVLDVNDDWLLGRDAPMERSDLQQKIDTMQYADAKYRQANDQILQLAEVRRMAILFHRADLATRKAVSLILQRFADIPDSEEHGYLQHEV